MSLFSPHSSSLTVLFSEVERFALEQEVAFVGSAGSVIQRSNARDFRFYAHKYYDGLGKAKERYIAGPVGDAEADQAADALRGRITEFKGIASSLRLLAREGFAVVDAKTFATVASIHNAGVFAGGGMLVGSHAYGVMLNRMGVRSAPYATEDIDIARAKALDIEGESISLAEILAGTGIDFLKVPSLNRKGPSTSYKERRAKFHVDLLAPSKTGSYITVPVPELSAHATGLPHFGYLVAEAQSTMIMSRANACMVRVPLPERYAVHKLIVSQLRTGRNAKSDKDIEQACVLCAVLASQFPGAITEALGHVPKKAKKALKAGIEAARDKLKADDPRAWEELAG